MIIGIETGNRKNKATIERSDVDEIVHYCHRSKSGLFKKNPVKNWIDIPVFMKSSLAEIWGKPLIREYPWE